MIGLPRPFHDEYPAAYAYRIGQWYLSWNKQDKSLGQFFTPLTIARFMAQLVPRQHKLTRVLDPGAGLGILSCALCETLDSDIELEAYEVDLELVDCLNACLLYTQIWMEARGRYLKYKIVCDDFVLKQADTLYWSTNNPFDIVISNPPYFKLSKSDPKAKVANIVVHGQPNIYALFLAVSAALVRPGGYAVFITPRSFAAGQYFSRFREYFFNRMKPRAIHIFESRRDVFEDVLQESLIMLAEHSVQPADVVLSSNVGSVDFNRITRRNIPIDDIITKDNILHLPLSENDDAIAELVRSWTGNLQSYGMQISTGPVVPFRAEKLVHSIGSVPSTHAPLLWIQNVKSMCWEWPQPRKGQYLLLNGADKLLLPNRNYVLLRRFSAKEERKRLTAAPYLASIYTDVIGVENHLNYIYRPNGCLSEDEARGLAALFNSNFMNSYFRIFSGNTQVNATELRKLPLPNLDVINELGRLASKLNADVDTIAAEVLRLYA
ncbi:MAG: Eco57I restriction-modification methylase domain-containing protein [Anaerolineae bacterium]|nr:Eco57I restriction-modification methylase domain-containing protein [Anaerolineae bacterium]